MLGQLSSGLVGIKRRGANCPAFMTERFLWLCITTTISFLCTGLKYYKRFLLYHALSSKDGILRQPLLRNWLAALQEQLAILSGFKILGGTNKPVVPSVSSIPQICACLRAVLQWLSTSLGLRTQFSPQPSAQHPLSLLNLSLSSASFSLTFPDLVPASIPIFLFALPCHFKNR